MSGQADSIRDNRNKGKFSCGECEYSSKYKSHLTRHTRKHTGERPFKCDKCDYAATRR